MGILEGRSGRFNGNGGREWGVDGGNTGFAIFREFDPFVVFCVSLLLHCIIPKTGQSCSDIWGDGAKPKEASSFLRSEEVPKCFSARALRVTVFAVMLDHCGCILARRHVCKEHELARALNGSEHAIEAALNLRCGEGKG